jgi:hypothetical protein
MQCEDCDRRADANDSERWATVRLESDRGIEVLTYCDDCAKQFESGDISPIEPEGEGHLDELADAAQRFHDRAGVAVCSSLTRRPSKRR